MKTVSLRPSRLLKLSPLCLLIGLSGCASAPPAPPAVTVVDNCKAFRSLTWSVDDTPDTSSQIKRHNRTFSALCKPKP